MIKDSLFLNTSSKILALYRSLKPITKATPNLKRIEWRLSENLLQVLDHAVLLLAQKQGTYVSRNSLISVLVLKALKDLYQEISETVVEDWRDWKPETKKKRAETKGRTQKRQNRSETPKQFSAPKRPPSAVSTSRKEDGSTRRLEIKEAAQLLLSKIKSPKERKIVQEAIENGQVQEVDYYDINSLLNALNSGDPIEDAKIRTSLLVPDHLFEQSGEKR